MVKSIKYFLLIFIIFLSPILVSCDNNRPNFPMIVYDKIEEDSSVSDKPNNSEDNTPSTDKNNSISPDDNNNPSNDNNEDNNKNESPSISKNFTVHYDNNIIISSTDLISSSNGYAILKPNSKIKINFINLETIISSNDKTFYLDKTTNSIVYGFSINNNEKSLNDLNKSFNIETDTTIKLLKSDLNLNSILFAQRYEFSNSKVYEDHEKFYHKFTTKSNNFRNSLICFENEEIVFSNNPCLYYISLYNKSNLKHKITYNDSINIKISTYDEISEIVLMFAYLDNNGNIFLSDYKSITNFSPLPENKILNFDIFDSNYKSINLEFAKYIFNQ